MTIHRELEIFSTAEVFFFLNFFLFLRQLSNYGKKTKFIETKSFLRLRELWGTIPTLDFAIIPLKDQFEVATLDKIGNL